MANERIAEKSKRLEELEEKLNKMGFHSMRPPFEEEFKGIESLYDLMLWNLLPMEAIAAMIEKECEAGNIAPIDILTNDLKVRLEDLRKVIETWMGGELQGRLQG